MDDITTSSCELKNVKVTKQEKGEKYDLQLTKTGKLSKLNDKASKKELCIVNKSKSVYTKNHILDLRYESTKQSGLRYNTIIEPKRNSPEKASAYTPLFYGWFSWFLKALFTFLLVFLIIIFIIFCYFFYSLVFHST